jgi:hypothetical protein
MLRRLADLLVIFSGVLILLRHYGIDPTPALAGLGVGGIAIALAAQKTLENVIAGASLIFDQAVRVGDFLKMGDVQGTVDKVGLRSTRIRTLDRTIVSVPNSQIANVSLETLSERDKFWFHPVVGLRYETTSAQMRQVLDGIRQMLARQSEIDGASIRVRFLRLAASSLDVETFAYVYARDWAHFLEIQEGLLLKITEIVSAAGTGIAFPSIPPPHNSPFPSDAQRRWALFGRWALRSCAGRADREAAAQGQMQIDALNALLGLHQNQRGLRGVDRELTLRHGAHIGRADAVLCLDDLEGALVVGERLCQEQLAVVRGQLRRQRILDFTERT